MKRILFFCAAMLTTFTCNAQIIQILKDGEVIYECSETEGVEVVFKERDPYNGHEYVDLGLPSGLKWATCNVGATTPEGYGDYFAWGEVEPKAGYTWGTYFDSPNHNGSNFTKYATYYRRTVLDIEDDVAHVNWGGDWRMPTDAELAELCAKCSWKWTSQGGVNGYVVTGPNGNFIFMPAAGYHYEATLYLASSYGYYWSSSLGGYYSDCGVGLRFYSDEVSKYDNARFCGQSVRPVCP